MSNTSKTVIWVVVGLVVLGGVWMLLAKPADDYTAVAPVTTDTTSQDQGAAMQQSPSTTTATATNASVSNPSDTSDAAINSDSAAIDTQMSGLSTDSSATAPASDSTQ
jgi:hypothetical protein